jgi:hypothetical protein
MDRWRENNSFTVFIALISFVDIVISSHFSPPLSRQGKDTPLTV